MHSLFFFSISDSFVCTEQLLFERGLVHLCSPVDDNSALLSRIVGEIAVAATHELVIVAALLDREVSNGVALLPVVGAADAHLARDDTVDLGFLARLEPVEEARVLPLLNRVGLLKVK